MPSIGLLFRPNMSEDSKRGAAYRVLFDSVDLRRLAGCSISDGIVKSRATSAQFCIAIQSPYQSTINELFSILSEVKSENLPSVDSRFLNDIQLSQETLLPAAKIDYRGMPVECRDSGIESAYLRSSSQRPSSRRVTQSEHRIHDFGDPVQWNIGDIIQNRWKVRAIKRGGMGIVYIGVDNYSGELFAAKTFHEYLFARSPQVAERFEQEASIWIKLAPHPNVTQAKYIESIAGRPYLFLEYVGGGDLSTWIGPRLTMNVPQALSFAIQFCDGMRHAYENGIAAHRDIKPNNCLITIDDRLLVTDFGLANTFNEIESTDTTVRNPVFRRLLGRLSADIVKGNWYRRFRNREIHSVGKHGIVGTFTYMAPEQFNCPDGADVRSDIYSFGVMLYQMLTGQLPFWGHDRDDFEFHHTHTSPPPLTLQVGVPSATTSFLDSILQKCLKKSPSDRFTDFDSVRQGLVETLKSITSKEFRAPVVANNLGADRWNDRGLSLYKLGQLDEALICLDRALGIAPNLHTAWNNKGLVLMDQERLLEALGCFEHAATLKPLYPDAWNNRGAMLNKLGRLGEALACFRYTCEIDRQHAMAWNNTGVVLNAEGKYEEAIRCFDCSIELNPHYGGVWLNKAIALGKLGHYQDVWIYLERSQELGNEEAKRILEQLRVGEELDKQENAKLSVDQILRDRPDAVTPVVGYGE